MYGDTPVKSKISTDSREPTLPATENQISDISQLSSLIVKLSNDVSALKGSINDRIDKLETSLESRISQKVANMLDKRINNEVTRIQKDLDTKMQSFRDDVRSDLQELDDKFASLAARTMDSGNNTKHLNFVIRGLPFHEGENVNAKVNSLIQVGLGLRTVEIVSA